MYLCFKISASTHATIAARLVRGRTYKKINQPRTIQLETHYVSSDDAKYVMNRMVLVKINPGGFRLGDHWTTDTRQISLCFQFWGYYWSIWLAFQRSAYDYFIYSFIFELYCVTFNFYNSMVPYSTLVWLHKRVRQATMAPKGRPTFLD